MAIAFAMVASASYRQTTLPFIDTLSASDAAEDHKQKLSLYDIAMLIYTGNHKYGYALSELQIDFDAGGTGAGDITCVCIQRNDSMNGGPQKGTITTIPGASVPGYSGYFGRGSSGETQKRRRRETDDAETANGEPVGDRPAEGPHRGRTEATEPDRAGSGQRGPATRERVSSPAPRTSTEHRPSR